MHAVVAGESGDWRDGGLHERGERGQLRPSVAIIATPTTGWSFAGWSDGNASASRTLSANSPTQTLTATFTQNQCTLSLLASPVTGGTVGFTSGASAGNCGRSVAIIATPTTGWSFAGWSDGNASASRTLPASSPTQTLTATFTQNQCSLSLLASPVTGGTVGFTSGASAGNCGRSVAIIATPTTGWSFAGWSDGSANASRTLTADLAAQTLTATFTQNQCSLSLLASPVTGGTVGFTSGASAGNAAGA
ncbi:MAG: hypothetical protein IPP90_08560 [Gemmatimonadaceae bacterium]|nr:hypothetical protein [Gemmatimonadaceae bacterium]